MSFRRCIPRPLAATTAVLALLAGLAAFPPNSSAGPTLGALNQQLSQQRAHQQQLQSSLGSLNSLIASLTRQIALVESREAAVNQQLAADRAALAQTNLQLQRQRRLVALLKARLARGRQLLSRQLISSYESGSPDLVGVVLQSNGFTDLLDRLTFLGDAEHQQQRIISITKLAKVQADAAVTRLAGLQARQQQMTKAAAVEARALAGMNWLLHSKQGELEQAQAAQRSALAASQTRSGQIQSEISQIEAQQAAAERAAAQRAAAQQASAQQASAQQAGAQQAGAQQLVPQSPVSNSTLGASGGWVIPYAIVACESGGQNLPPNSAGASGYYQIIPSTWRLFGGTGPAAYMASKAEQDAVASRIWAGGAGASNWVCAGIVGIH
jgi:peptidoglycan hydrolase CwlO-like protein